MENFTIPVPNGTTNHGNPNLICTPVTWTDTFVFFAANYFAHAFTVKQLPGEELSQYAFAVVATVFYPYAGLPRGIESIFRRAVFFRSSELETAARAGALCVVVRQSRWRPVAGQTQIEDVQVHESTTKKARRNSEDLPLTRSDDVELGTVDHPRSSPGEVTLRISYSNLNRRQIPNPSGKIVGRNVHGLTHLPRGYQLATLPDNVAIGANAEDAPTKDFHISSSYNLAQVIVSLVQLISSSVTLYHARGDQLEHYGYAAFGLTVLPYITMSIVNFVGNLVTPNYQALYLVHSPELDEAKLHGGKFDGTVGVILKPEGSAAKMSNGRTVTFEGDDGSIFKVHNPSTGKDNHFTALPEKYLRPPRLILETQQVLDIPACTPFRTTGSKSSHDGWLTALGYVFFAIPYAVIGGLTHFHNKKSTKAQRSWMMVWLVFDTLFGYLAGRPDPINHDEFSSFIFLIFAAAPAIGGFVVVGQMLKHYGSCLDINSGF